MKMATFGKFDTTIVPSEFGEKFTIDTHVTFMIHGTPQIRRRGAGGGGTKPPALHRRRGGSRHGKRRRYLR